MLQLGRCLADPHEQDVREVLVAVQAQGTQADRSPARPPRLHHLPESLPDMKVSRQLTSARLHSRLTCAKMATRSFSPISQLRNSRKSRLSQGFCCWPDLSYGLYSILHCQKHLYYGLKTHCFTHCQRRPLYGLKINPF